MLVQERRAAGEGAFTTQGGRVAGQGMGWEGRAEPLEAGPGGTMAVLRVCIQKV